jgi:hypothetical protein
MRRHAHGGVASFTSTGSGSATPGAASTSCARPRRLGSAPCRGPRLARLAPLPVDGERLALGTFDLERSAPDGNCTPRAAIDALPPGGAFIYVFEYVDPATSSGQMVRWRDHGRAFQAHVYFGPDATSDLKRDAMSILNSIQAR